MILLPIIICVYKSLLFFNIISASEYVLANSLIFDLNNKGAQKLLLLLAEPDRDDTVLGSNPLSDGKIPSGVRASSLATRGFFTVILRKQSKSIEILVASSFQYKIIHDFIRRYYFFDSLAGTGGLSI